MPENAQKTHWWSTGGPWGTGLLLLGIAGVVQGIGYCTPGRLPAPLESLSTQVPAWVWGSVWIAAGLWSCWSALTPPQRHWHVLPFAAVLMIWSAAYLMYWLTQGIVHSDWTRGWSAALGWGMLAGLVVSWGRCINPPRRP